MRRPRIGITMAGTGEPNPTSEPARHGLALERAGAGFRYLGVDADPRTAFDAIDAIVFSGGADVDPQRYGGDPLRCEPPDPARDAVEFAMLTAAEERGLPIFGVCRGMQLVNVALGGTLVEDIPSGVVAALGHDQRERGLRDEEMSHTVSFDPASRLVEIAGATRARTNSLHHQAVSRVAPMLRAVGQTSDRVIEALESCDPSRFLLAVQWHPERLIDDPVSDRLYEALVAAARG